MTNTELDFAIAGFIPGERVKHDILDIDGPKSKPAEHRKKRITGTCVAVYPRFALVQTDAGYRTTVSHWHL